jgi:serine/threonine-protein kinase HipA
MPATTLTIFAHLPGGGDAAPAGRLELREDGRRTLGSRFIYGRRYLDRPNRLAIDPISLPLTSGATTEGWRLPANGLVLFGAIRDATPDMWGRKVIENKLKAPPDGLPESAYLLHAGSNRIGALDVRPEPTSPPVPGLLPGAIDLSHLVEAAERVEAGEPVPSHLELIFEGAPSLGGARPKAVIGHEGRQWVAKFPLRSDRFDIPRIERTTLELARRAGMQVPETRIVLLDDGRTVMLVERFDRRYVNDVEQRVHMVSGLTMLGKEEADSASYSDLSMALSIHGAPGYVATDREELFRRMVFNILVGNDDDHLRNHAFLHDAGGWRLSPLYDVLPKPQIATERTLVLAVGDEGRTATLGNALSRCERFGLNKQKAATIINAVALVVREWRVHFEELGCPPAQCERVKTAFRRPADIGLHEVEDFL